MENNLKNEKHIKKVYSEKCRNLLKICLVILICNFISYIIPYFINEANFDFGFIFETISFIFILLSLNSIDNNLNSTKRNILISIIPIGWLLIYDFIYLLMDPFKLFDLFLMYISPYFNPFYLIYFSFYVIDLTLIVTLILLYKSYKSISKALNTEKEVNFVEDFYDKL